LSDIEHIKLVFQYIPKKPHASIFAKIFLLACVADLHKLSFIAAQREFYCFHRYPHAHGWFCRGLCLVIPFAAWLSPDEKAAQ